MTRLRAEAEGQALSCSLSKPVPHHPLLKCHGHALSWLSGFSWVHAASFAEWPQYKFSGKLLLLFKIYLPHLFLRREPAEVPTLQFQKWNDNGHFYLQFGWKKEEAAISHITRHVFLKSLLEIFPVLDNLPSPLPAAVVPFPLPPLTVSLQPPWPLPSLCFPHPPLQSLSSSDVSGSSFLILTLSWYIQGPRQQNKDSVWDASPWGPWECEEAKGNVMFWLRR